MTQDGLYWLFSSSAQTIGSFSAFLLTGFALVLTILDGVQDRDSSQAEVHAALKRKYHLWLRILSWATAVAILFSLALVASQGLGMLPPRWLVAVGALVNAAALLGGVFFTVSVTDPTRYERAARRLLEDQMPEGHTASEDIEASEFIRVFIGLERLARQFAMGSDIPTSVPTARFGFLTLPQLVNGLRSHGIISDALAGELAEIARYRNLVVHGEVTAVDRVMYDRLVAALAQLATVAKQQGLRAT